MSTWSPSASTTALAARLSPDTEAFTGTEAFKRHSKAGSRRPFFIGIEAFDPAGPAMGAFDD
jgi:hypothetical protein